MNNRLLRGFLAAIILAAFVAPAAIAADMTDVGFIDLAEVANQPVFVSANQQLYAYKAALDQQYATAIKGAKSDADKQRISMQFQQQYNDKQRELVGPVFQREQFAVAQAAAAHNLSVVVDKRIIIFGGQDITKDVLTLFSSSQAVQPPAASPAPSSIGYVDQNALDGLPKVKAANDEMQQFQETQRALFAPKVAAAKTDADKQAIYAQFKKVLQDKQDALLKPLVDQTQAATAAAAKKRNLLLVVDRADIIYGGTDITSDVQSILGK